MTLASQIVSDVPTVFLNTDDFAETVTYYPRGRAKLSIAADVRRREDTRVTGFDDGRSKKKEATIHIQSSAVDSAIGDRITFDGVTWEVVGRSQRGGGMQTLELASVESVEKSPGDRRLGR
jgi:hypothetical protein